YSFRLHFFFSSRRRHTRSKRDWSSDVCSSDLTAAWAEYEHFLALLEAAGVDTLRLPPDHTVGLDSLYARDVSIVCDRGVILCNMGKPQRRTEPAAQEAAFRAAGIPIWGRITGDGTVEGGDVCWIDEIGRAHV